VLRPARHRAEKAEKRIESATVVGPVVVMKFFVLILKNLLRNLVRTVLTALAVILLVAIFTMIVTVLRFLENAMAARETDVPLVVTERFRIPSRFDRRYLE
jgi:uncharacterized membrane protein